MKYYAVVGNPISHSLSPQMMNASFETMGIEALYTRMLIKDINELKSLINYIPFAGFNITSPFKKESLSLANEKDDTVSLLEVTNTLVKGSGRSWIAYNTDIIGATNPLLKVLGSLKNKKILVLGAGGAAEAAILGLKRAGAKISIYNRSQEKAEKLAGKYACFLVLKENLLKELDRFEAIVNTIPVLLKELLDHSFSSDQYIVDASYKNAPFSPYISKKQHGNYIGGKQWLLQQAIQGFNLFTGLNIEESIIRKGLLEFPERRKESITLIGPMAAGKSSVGKKLAMMLNFDFIDLDRLIEERQGLPISQIFKQYGEAFFRDLEFEELSRFSGRKGYVIACGGGVVEQKRNRSLLENSHCVLLMVDPKTSISRNKGDRPLLDHEDPLYKAEEIFNRRLHSYLSIAHVLVNAKESNPKDIANLIAEDFKSTFA